MSANAYRVEAYNTAKHSENRIHDDSVARRFGFTGGLVPGVDVYAYMTHMPVRRWGRAWLERGTIECRFGKPVYDGEIADISSVDSADAMTIAVASKGDSCATGSAGMTTPGTADPAAWGTPLPVPADRPPADRASLAEGRVLAMNPLHVTPDFAAGYLADVREASPLYAAEGLIHPGAILRTGNRALVDNVVLGPWIHVGSKVRNLSAGRVGETLTCLARVARNYEHKGHLFVDLDMLVMGDARPLAQVLHTAIYRPRQVAEAA